MGSIESVLAFWYAMNRHMCPPLHCYTSAGWGRILGILDFGGRSEPVWYVVLSLLRLKPLMKYNLFPYDMCRKWFGILIYAVYGICCHPYCDTPLQVGGGFWSFGFGGRPEPEWCCNVMVEATTGFWLDPTTILDVNKVFVTLICCVWAYEATRWGWILGFWG